MVVRWISDDALVDIRPFAADTGKIEVTVTEGDSVLLDLPQVDSTPPASVQWTDAMGRRVLDTDSVGYHVAVSNQLLILNTGYDSHNHAVYQATATNGYTQQTSFSPPYMLRVQRRTFAQMLL